MFDFAIHHDQKLVQSPFALIMNIVEDMKVLFKKGAKVVLHNFVKAKTVEVSGPIWEQIVRRLTVKNREEALAFWETVPVEILQEVKDSFTALCLAEILVPITYRMNRPRELERIKKQLRKPSQIQMMDLILAERQEREKRDGIISFTPKPIGMTFSTIEKSFNLFSRIVKGNNVDAPVPTIVLRGVVSPLANKAGIKKVFELRQQYIQEKKLPLETKVVLYTSIEEIKGGVEELFGKNQTEVLVSVTEKDVSKLGKYKLPLKNLQKQGVNSIISLIISEDNVRNLGSMLKYFINQGVKIFDLNPHIEENETYDHQINIINMVNEIWEIAEENPDIFVIPINDAFNNFMQGRARSTCMGCGQKIAIRYTGDIYHCLGYQGENDKSLNLTIETATPEILVDWLNPCRFRDTLSISDCNKLTNPCQALLTCGGGCPVAMRKRTGNLFTVFNRSNFCVFARAIHDRIVEEQRVQQSAGNIVAGYMVAI